VLLVGAVLLLGGCSSSDDGDGGPSTDATSGSDTDAAAQVALEFYEALGDNDREHACELLSSLERNRMTSLEDNLSSQEGRASRGCAGGLEYGFRPDPIVEPEVADVAENNGAVEVFLTTATDQGLRAQVVAEDDEWRVDEIGTAVEPVRIEPVCSEDGAADPSDLPPADPDWITTFQEAYYVDLSDDRVVTSAREYTQTLVDALEECGMTEEVFDQLVDSVVAASPTSLNAPSEYTFDSFGGEQLFTCQLVNVAANTYEVTACQLIETGDSS